jgi:hypothetical protein
MAIDAAGMADECVENGAGCIKRPARSVHEHGDMVVRPLRKRGHNGICESRRDLARYVELQRADAQFTL